ncbi:hypothetical protein FGIG_02837 [Fasciola gigantica]|uniref:Major facilitator superfamily (MFS) profile domain-containing protein n=1 Tax=Fasciola gigantica TaxID=46835 RepID=A0A504YHC0_FASGI|nr:hypothetical protein FGIG_02837 [Fasciola gigantica]
MKMELTQNEPHDFEIILNHIYGKGHYLRLAFIFCSITTLLAGLEVQTMIFMNYVPEHNCTDDRVVGDNATSRWVSKLSHHNGTDVNRTQMTKKQAELTEQCWAIISRQTEVTHFPCTNWTFDTTVMLRTVVSQFNLVCDRQVWIPWLESSYLFANAIGYIIASFGDMVGRKRTFLLFVVLEIIVCLVTPFIRTVSWLLVMRILRGLSICLMYLGINLISEFAPVHLRSAYGNVFWSLWGVGYALCAGIAYLTRDWIQLRLWMCLFLLFYLPCPFVLSESPRWLCLRGQTEEAGRVLKRVAYWNGAHLPDEYFDKVDIFLHKQSYKTKENFSHSSLWKHPSDENDSGSRDTFRDLFTHPNLRFRCIVFCFAHTTVTFVYYGLITDNSFATENIFLNVFLMGLTEIPSGFVAWALCDYMGRRTSTSVLLVLTALCVGFTNLGDLTYPDVRTVMATTGKFFLGVVYCVSDLYILEVFPTSIRTSSFFLIITVAGLFGAGAPFVNSLRRIARMLPTIIYCMLAVTGAILVLTFLPETRGCPLAQTVNESEQLVRGKERQWAERMKLGTPDAFVRLQKTEVTKDEVLSQTAIL